MVAGVFAADYADCADLNVNKFSECFVLKELQ
jgi:hypothetical protein